MRKPDVSANNGSGSDNGIPAQNGGIGVNNHIIFNRWMALLRPQSPAFRFGQRQSAQRNPLIDTHPVADGACFSNNNACAMVNKKTIADVRSRMNINTGLAVSIFRT